jgi:hypothetical protein
MGANELSSMLWRERELLDLLTFKLVEEQLLLTAGKSQWLQHATREVEQVVTQLRTTGLSRAVEASALALAWGISPEANLREIAAAAPAGPWGDLLTGHLEALNSQTAVITSLRDSNEQFLRAATRSAQETAAGIRPERVMYDARGKAGTAASTARLFDSKL